MNRSTRMLLMTGASVAAAISLTFASVAAQDAEEATDEMDSMAPIEEMEPGLFVTDPWARESPMLDLAGAAYMVIHNSTDADDALVGVSSPAAEFVELHLSSMDDEGMMSMNQVAEIAVLNNNYLEKLLLAIPGVTESYGEGKVRLDQIRYSWEKLTEDTGVTSEDVERRLILAALEQEGWRMTDVARTLGLERSHLYKKLRALDIQRPE